MVNRACPVQPAHSLFIFFTQGRIYVERCDAYNGKKLSMHTVSHPAAGWAGRRKVIALGLSHSDFMILFDRWAATYDQTVYREVPADGFEGYDHVLERVATLSGAAPGKRVMDIGAGTGNLSQVLLNKGARVTAIEPSAEMRAIAVQKLGRTQVLDGQFLKLPARRRSFDAVVSTYAFHHLTDAEKVVGGRNMLSVLRPGGVIVLGDVAWANEAARNQMIKRLQQDGKHELVREIEVEYYATVGFLTSIFAVEGCSVYVEQQNAWVWVLVAHKAIV